MDSHSSDSGSEFGGLIRQLVSENDRIYGRDDASHFSVSTARPCQTTLHTDDVSVFTDTWMGNYLYFVTLTCCFQVT